jgi:hypothetical protein
MTLTPGPLTQDRDFTLDLDTSPGLLPLPHGNHPKPPQWSDHPMTTKRLEHLPIPEQLTLELILQDPRYPWVKASHDYFWSITRQRDALLAKVGLKFHSDSCLVISDEAKLMGMIEKYRARSEKDKHWCVARYEGE